MGRAEVLADRKQIEPGIAGAKGIRASNDALKDLLVRLPGIRSLASHVCAVGRIRKRTYRVALEAARARNGRAEIQEGVHVDLIEEDANAAAHHQIACPFRLIGEADARGKVIPIRRENGADPRSLDEQSLPRDKDRNVLAVAMQRAKVFIAETEIQVQLLGKLPGILEIQVVSIHLNKAFRISHSNSGGRYVAGKKVGQRRGIRITPDGRSRGNTSRVPWPLCSIEGELSSPTAVIELVHVRLADLSPETELVFPHGVGDDVGQMAGDVVAALRRRESDLLKPGNGDVRGTEDGLAVVSRVRDQEQ